MRSYAGQRLSSRYLFHLPSGCGLLQGEPSPLSQLALQLLSTGAPGIWEPAVRWRAWRDAHSGARRTHVFVCALHSTPQWPRGGASFS